MRDILILNAAFPDSFQEIIVVHHTDCGSLRFKDDGMDKLVKNVIGEAHSAAIDNVAWAGWGGGKRSVSPFLCDSHIRKQLMLTIDIFLKQDWD